MPPQAHPVDVDVRVARSEEDVAAHHRVRRAVFVEEQGIFEEHDEDEWDAAAVKVVASVGGRVLGAVRLYPLDEAGLWKGDRLAVLPEGRRMRLGAPDVTGRQVPEIVPGSSFKMEADLVIKALGFDPEDVPAMFGEPALEVSRWGTIRIDWSTMMTAMPGVFAAGDIVRGASLVVWGIRDGRDAAAGIHDYLMSRAAAEAPRLALAS